MSAQKDYLDINRNSWNKRTEVHLKSAFYDMAGFLKGNSSLNDIELGLLGDIGGKSILHLQCHFGQDTISLSRLGASVVGVDLSDKAIATAKKLATTSNTNTQFICCDLYDLPNHLDQSFDIVFASYGTIGWLPDLHRWAQVISTFLKPDGQFIFVEFHPMLWMFDETFEKLTYSYFNTGAMLETEHGTYADKDAPIVEDCVIWNHSLGDVIHNLIKNGLSIQSFEEFDYSPYDCFHNIIEVAPKRYRIKHLDGKIPMIFSICARKEH